MGRIGCDIDGHLDDTNFSKPMPWIGIYIAAASLACLVAMAADAISGIRHRKLWFPSKYFCLNATSLTLIAVAVKLSVDLNTAMPHRPDQLSKLSSSALICTIMGNSMPSLGSMENKEILMNVMAMGILVITVIVNICIQLVTGVIYEFWKEHIVMMFLMLILFMTMSSSAIALPKMKHYLELKYKVNEVALKESSNQMGEQPIQAKQITDKLRDELMKYWMMAHTSSPQFVIGRSVTCTASGAFCLLSALTLAEAMLRSYLMPWSFKFCTGGCDYKWSIILILIIQATAVVVGTFGPAFRWFIAINYRCPEVRKNKSGKRRFEVEGYWTNRLVLIKETPLGLRIHNRHYRKLAHDAKLSILIICIKLQKGIVLICKAIQLVSIFLMCWILSCCDYCKTLKCKLHKSVSSVSCGSGSRPDTKLDLRRFVLHLEGEEELVAVMMRDNRDATVHWVQEGEKKQPKHLIELIEKSTFLQGFKGVGAFDSDRIFPLHEEDFPNNWSLPMVTLASIVAALPNINRSSVKKLVNTLNEGLPYVKFIENMMDKDGKLIKVRKAAEIVWLGIDLYQKWLDVDLCKLDQGESPKETLEKLSDAAKFRYGKCKAKYIYICKKVSPASWPIKLIAANSMYRISQTLLLNQESKKDTTSERLFETITVMISDIMAACLTNLPHVISTSCLSSGIEKREDSVRHAVYILGKTKKIIEILVNSTGIINSDFSKGTGIDDWRLMHKQDSALHCAPSSLENGSETDPPKLSDICLNID